MNIWISRFLTLTITVTVLTACSGNKAEPAPPQAPAETNAAAAKKPAPAAKKPAPKKPAPKKPIPLKVATSWNFGELEKPMWGWNFPSPGVKKTYRGAFYTRTKSGPGPRWEGDPFKASEIKGVRIELQIFQKDDPAAEAKPLKLVDSPVVYWAHPEDVTGNDWPFDPKRNAPLRAVQGKNPNLYEVRLDKQKDWKGEIAQLFFSVPVPKELGAEDHPYGVLISRIQFLK